MIYGLLALLAHAASIHHYDVSFSKVIQSTNFLVFLPRVYCLHIQLGQILELILH